MNLNLKCLILKKKQTQQNTAYSKTGKLLKGNDLSDH